MEFLKGMEMEHSANCCCDQKFTTLHDLTTTPRAEWNLIVGKNVPETAKDGKNGRRFPNLDSLEQLDLSRQANLRRFEIIAVVLYTGPMVSLTRILSLLMISCIEYHSLAVLLVQLYASPISCRHV